MKLFVYGTLMQGLRLHSQLGNSPLLEKGSTPGRLYDKGGYPAAVFGGTGRVQGEVYNVTPEILRRLDFVEGVPYTYQRIKTNVLLNTGHAVTAWAYQWNRETDGLPDIEHGDYRLWRK